MGDVLLLCLVKAATTSERGCLRRLLQFLPDPSAEIER